MGIQCWGNPVIRVDLTSGNITKEFINANIREKFLTGRGLGDWLLYNNVEPGKTDPLGPDNVIIFSSGILLGTSFPGAVRNSVVSLNVLTNGYGESSSAGFFALRLKKAGYDGIIICGKSARLSYLWIENDHIELKDASKLSGKTTFETDNIIKEELNTKDISTCTIGPAGEKLVRYSIINCDNRYLGRCGMGAVMGSKRLKAIAVKGTGSIVLADKKKFNQIELRIKKLLTEHYKDTAAKGSAAGGAEGYNEKGLLPVKNYQEVDFDGASLTGYEYIKKYYKGVIHCPNNCPVKCDRLIEIKKGDPYGGTRVSSMQATPAYNTAKLLIDDMPTTIKVFELCNAYGIDIHSWTTVMSWAIECFERNIISREDTDRLELRWGDGPLLLESIRRIAYREGKFGDLLAEGVAIASKKTGRGSEKYAMHIKGMEIDDELRVDKGMTLGILAETRGAGHTLGAIMAEREMSPEKAKKLFGTQNITKPYVYDDKADLVVMAERYAAIQDCLGLCFFSTGSRLPTFIDKYNMKTYAELVSTAAGYNISEQELSRIAERILTVEKLINISAGISRKDEIPPDRFFEPIPDGRSKGLALDREKLDNMLRRHSELHGWDPETGKPTKETLIKLNLNEGA